MKAEPAGRPAQLVRLRHALLRHMGAIGLILLIGGVLGCFLGGILIGLLLTVSRAPRAVLVSPMVASLVFGSVLVVSGITTLRVASTQRALQVHSGPRPEHRLVAQAWIPLISLSYAGGVALLAYFGLAVGGQRGFQLGAGSLLLAFTIGSVACVQYQQALRHDIRFMFGWSAARTRAALLVVGLVFALGDFGLVALHG